jgi:hypothetical protein
MSERPKDGRRATHLLMVVKHTVAPERTSANDVPIGHDVAILSIHHEPGSLGGKREIGVKGARLAEVDRHHTLDDSFYGGLPLWRVSRSRHGVHDWQRARLGLNVVHRAILRSSVSGCGHSVLLLQLLFWPFQSRSRACPSFESKFAIGRHSGGRSGTEPTRLREAKLSRTQATMRRKRRRQEVCSYIYRS